MPPEREMHQMTFENGIILGYANREHEVPEGYVLKAHNLIVQDDGSLAPRPALMVTPANGNGADPTEVKWDQAITARHRVLTRQDNTNQVAGRTSPTHVAIPFVGTTVPPGSNAFYSQYMLVGQAATYGTTTVVPIARPTRDTVADPGTGPFPGRLAVIHLLHFNSASTVPTAVNTVNLYDANGHFIVQEPLRDQTPNATNVVFARMVAIAWKSRIFVIAGTRVTYSAVGQPTVYAAASGGGFFNLDTDSQIVGAFVLDDNMYLLTRRELFIFNYSNNPAVDGQLRKMAQIQGLGAAEYDNIGYLAVREGLFRVVSGNIEPTFIPSSQPHTSFQSYDVPAETGVETQRFEIPPHCVISKVGNQIIVSGVGTNLVEADFYDNPIFPVFNISTESWTTWQGALQFNDPQISPARWPNLLTPLIRTDVQDEWGSEQYVGTNLTTRDSRTDERMRSFIVINTENLQSSEPLPTDSQMMRWQDTYVSTSSGVISQIYGLEINPELVTPFYNFETPLDLKRLHRLWMTGKFKPQDNGSDIDTTLVELRVFLQPDNIITVTNKELLDENAHVTPEMFDISPYEIKFFGALRFMYLSFRVVFKMQDLVTITDTGFKFANLAISSLFFDITRTDRKSNRSF